jgi:hypothetical protein
MALRSCSLPASPMHVWQAADEMAFDRVNGSAAHGFPQAPPAHWTLNNRCCRFEVCGRTSLDHRPRSTASAHCGLCRTCGSSIS